MIINQAIQDFIQGKRIAVIGVSRSGKKFGNTIYTELKGRGYQAFIVHPEVKETGGERCYPSLASIPGGVDGVLICVPPRQAGQAMREAVQAGVGCRWISAASKK